MLSGLMSSLGSEVEWLWVEAPLEWHPASGGTEYHDSERTELEIKISKGLPFREWYVQSGEGASPQHLLRLEEGFQRLEELLSAQAPVDVVVAFSSGANLAALYTE